MKPGWASQFIDIPNRSVAHAHSPPRPPLKPRDVPALRTRGLKPAEAYIPSSGPSLSSSPELSASLEPWVGPAMEELLNAAASIRGTGKQPPLD